MGRKKLNLTEEEKKARLDKKKQIAKQYYHEHKEQVLANITNKKVIQSSLITSLQEQLEQANKQILSLETQIKELQAQLPTQSLIQQPIQQITNRIKVVLKKKHENSFHSTHQ